MLRTKLTSIFAVMLMLAAPLMVIDPNCIGSVADPEEPSNDTDYRWTYVKDASELSTALAKGGNIKFTADITVGADQLVVGKKTTLNLGGKTITCSGTSGQAAIKVTSEAVIENGSINASGCMGIHVTGASSDAMLVLLTVTQTSASSAVACDNGGKVTIQNGTYTSDEYAVLLNNGGGSVTINDGTFCGKVCTVKIDAESAGNYKLKVLVGTFDNTVAETDNEYEVTGSSGTVDAQLFAGIFKGKVLANYGTTKIYGGSFEGAWAESSVGHITVYGGKYVNKPAFQSTTLIDADSVWDDSTYFVYQTKSVHIGSTYYNTLNDAINAASATDTISIDRTGTYELGVNKSMNIVGNKDADIVVLYKLGKYGDKANTANDGHKVNISNVTLYFATITHQGFINAAEEHFTNVTFWGLMYLYAVEKSTFDNCTINQYYTEYAIQHYCPDISEFNGCTFNGVGKSLLLYVDASKEYPGGLVYVNNTKFNDYGLLKDKSAIEAHTEWGLTPNYSWWCIYIDENTTANGFYKESECYNNLWNAVNNNLGSVSATTLVYVGDVRVFPAIYDVTLLDADGGVFKTIEDVDYGTMMADLDSVPTKTGFYFAGYYDELGSTLYFDANGKCVHKLDLRGDITLYPKWASEAKHGITYDINGATGTVPVDSNQYKEGATYTTATATGFSVEGFTFMGWSDGYKIYKAGTEYLMGASDITLKAVWSKSVAPPVGTTDVTITVIDSAGKAVEGADVYIGGTCKGETGLGGTLDVTGIEKKVQSVVVKIISDDVNSSKTVAVDFDTTTQVTVQFTDYTVRTTVEKSQASDIDMAVGDKINDLASEMKEKTGATEVELKVVVNNSTEMAESMKEQLDEMKNRSGESECVFFDVSLYLKADGVTEKVTDITGYDNKVLEFIIPFDATGKSSVSVWHCHENGGQYDYTEFVLDTAKSKTAGTFYIENGMIHVFTDKFSAFTVMSTEGGTFTAKIVVDGVTVEIIGNNIDGAAITLPECKETKEGYEFVGWECVESNGTIYQPGDRYIIHSNVEFRAVWKEIIPVVPEPVLDTVIATFIGLILALIAAIGVGTYARKH